MVYFIVLFSLFLVFCLSNIAARYIKKSKFYDNRVVKKQFLFLLIVPTKRQVLFMPFLNYIIQFLLFLTIFLLYLIDWVTSSADFLNCIWIYIIYMIISLASFAFSGILNKWNY